ncbi:hypothetical protein AcV7_001450 [Taiwanofungus camphoratus]|nr:hypothetical protein AcV7_001450 [Antrodia cinnamomea]
MFAFTLLPLAFAAAAVAFPTLNLRQDQAAGCTGLTSPSNALGSFTITAINTTLPNANSTGVPLVLAERADADGYQYYSLATYASAGYNDFPTFSLNNGALIPNADNPKVQAVDDAPIDGAMIRFTGSNDGSPLKAGAQVYCVSLLSNYDYPVLAVNGDLSSFSICYEPEGPLLQYNVIYKATSGSSSYDYSTCYPVQLLAIIQ